MAKCFFPRLLTTPVLLCAIGFSEPSLAQFVSSSDPIPEDQKLDYQLSCYAETGNPKILISPDLNGPIGRNIKFDRSYSFIPDRIIRQGSTQLLGGTLVTGTGRVVYKGVEFQDADRDQLFVLASEWHCKLYRGGKAWPRRKK